MQITKEQGKKKAPLIEFDEQQIKKHVNIVFYYSTILC